MASSNVDISQEYIAKFLSALPLLEKIQFYSTKDSNFSCVQWPTELPNLKHISFVCNNSSMIGLPGIAVPGPFVDSFPFPFSLPSTSLEVRFFFFFFFFFGFLYLLLHYSAFAP